MFSLYLKLTILNNLTILNFVIYHNLANEKYDFAVGTIYLTNKM